MDMKITPISNFIAFKSNIYDDENVLGFDDEISRQNRKFIREHYDEYRMPYQSIYENEGRKTEYQMDVLLKTLMNKPRKVDYHTMMGLPVCNVRLIGNNSYRGATLSDHPELLKTLKETGIKTVVDLAGYGSSYKNAVKNAGLDYLSFNMKHNDTMAVNSIWFHSVFDNRESRGDREFIDKFVKFIQTMQKGYCYIGCEFGTKDTTDALLLYDVFNPKAKNKVPRVYDGTKFDKFRALYSKLTDKDKKLMGWTEEFDKNFLPRLKVAEEQFLKNQEEMLRKEFGTDNLDEIIETLGKYFK